MRARRLFLNAQDLCELIPRVLQQQHASGRSVEAALAVQGQVSVAAAGVGGMAAAAAAAAAAPEGARANRYGAPLAVQGHAPILLP